MKSLFFCRLLTYFNNSSTLSTLIVFHSSVPFPLSQYVPSPCWCLYKRLINKIEIQYPTLTTGSSNTHKHSHMTAAGVLTLTFPLCTSRCVLFTHTHKHNCNNPVSSGFFFFFSSDLNDLGQPVLSKDRDLICKQRVTFNCELLRMQITLELFQMKKKTEKT